MLYMCIFMVSAYLLSPIVEILYSNQNKNKSFQSYSTDQMKGKSLTHLSLATNAFIANDIHVYCWSQTHLVMEKNTYSAVYERV